MAIITKLFSVRYDVYIDDDSNVDLLKEEQKIFQKLSNQVSKYTTENKVRKEDILSCKIMSDIDNRYNVIEWRLVLIYDDSKIEKSVIKTTLNKDKKAVYAPKYECIHQYKRVGSYSDNFICQKCGFIEHKDIVFSNKNPKEQTVEYTF